MLDPSKVLACTITLLLKAPVRLALYVTLTVPFIPGAIGSEVYDATVHPHDGFTEEITKGSSPEFVKVNSCVFTVPFLISPKSAFDEIQ